MSENANDKQAQPLTIVCLASYYKGVEFMQEAKRQGCRVLAGDLGEPGGR